MPDEQQAVLIVESKHAAANYVGPGVSPPVFAQLVRDAGFEVSLRSQWADAPSAAQVWVGDSLGEMAMYYGLAHVALLGGSFEPLGGQNLIEAAACGCPMVMGPLSASVASTRHSSTDRPLA